MAGVSQYITLYNPVEVHSHFRGTYYSYHQGQRVLLLLLLFGL
jgi:hypothetical protein